ncbi:hypothetical protein IC614_09045 [Allosphingosinicella flava]|uniref:Uncharacterized protein n=1 Tax=Allosphingosinicella flava TaxID=2771430 RepID=A0A7T2GIF6_9SPHN|nr:hypothetical protein [Sphingosinicella flava]QPQ54481.1 hypothetical protein IC614_09045 [Sphingosinicella flava]
MTRTIMTLAAVSAIALTGPAVSQTANVNANAGVTARVNQLQTRLQTGIQAGSITQSEAATLREQLRLLRQTERRYSRGGLTSTERRDLQARIQNLRQQIRIAERNTMTRYGSSGFIDRNDDGWDDRDANHDGRLDSGYYGQGGPLEDLEPCPNRTGIGGVIGNIFGGNRNNDCILQPGQRATNNLYGVPVDLRDEYRDDGGYYYRSDGRVIYQIDARTNLVTRVDPID